MKHISYDDGTVKAEIDIRPATTRDGIRRETLMYGELYKDPVLLRSQQLLGTLTAAADVQTLTVDGKPVKLTAETILDLPGTLTTLWSLAVFEVNPHWQFGITSEELEAIQKKALTPSSGSEDSTEAPTKAKQKT
jgi:hypothetical protein